MPLYLNKNKNVIFFHIPKTGGTSLESWLLENISSKQLLFDNFVQEDMSVTPQHLGCKTIKSILGTEIYEESYKFAVVRNPFDRLESEFFYRVKLGQVNLGKRPEQYFSFWLLDALKKYNKTPSIYDNHFRPQTYYVDNDTVVYKFENGIGNITSKIAKDFSIPHDSIVEHKKTSVRKPVYWSSKALHSISAIYNDDFVDFNYSQNSLSSTSRINFWQVLFIFIKYRVRVVLNFLKKLAKKNRRVN